MKGTSSSTFHQRDRLATRAFVLRWGLSQGDGNGCVVRWGEFTCAELHVSDYSLQHCDELGYLERFLCPNLSSRQLYESSVCLRIESYGHGFPACRDTFLYVATSPCPCHTPKHPMPCTRTTEREVPSTRLVHPLDRRAKQLSLAMLLQLKDGNEATCIGACIPVLLYCILEKCTGPRVAAQALDHQNQDGSFYFVRQYRWALPSTRKGRRLGVMPELSWKSLADARPMEWTRSMIIIPKQPCGTRVTW